MIFASVSSLAAGFPSATAFTLIVDFVGTRPLLSAFARRAAIVGVDLLVFVLLVRAMTLPKLLYLGIV